MTRWRAAGGHLTAAATLLTLTAAAPATDPKRLPHRDLYGEVLEATRKNAYEEGYLAGVDAVTPMPPMILHHLYDQDDKAKRYEACLHELALATTRNEYYLRAVANSCVALLPPGQ